jgi:predicted porin
MQIQKKIIALAIASALTAPALALADNAATFYGQANLSVDMVNDGAVTNSTSANQLNSNTSRLGLKGAEDLGSGLSAIYQFEGTLGPDTGTTALFDRNQYLGLKSDSMGTLVAGRMDTPYKTATRRFDLFGDGIADSRGSQVSGAAAGSPFKATMMGGGHDARLSNVIGYMSPSFSGVTIAVGTLFGAETTGVANATKGSAYSLAGMYEQGPIYATLAYQTLKAGTALTGDLAANATVPAVFGLVNIDDEAKATKVGVSYTVDMFQVNAEYEKVSTSIGAVTKTEKSQNDIYLSGKYNVSSTDAVKLAYCTIGDLSNNGATLSGAKQATLGYDHGMSKATTVYALYSKKTANAANGASPSVLSAGIRHSF